MPLAVFHFYIMEVTAMTYLGSKINDAVVFVPAYFMLQAQTVSNHRKTSLHMDSLVTLGFYKGIAPVHELGLSVACHFSPLPFGGGGWCSVVGRLRGGVWWFLLPPSLCFAFGRWCCRSGGARWCSWWLVGWALSFLFLLLPRTGSINDRTGI